jgi:hypothetical protein
MRSFFLIVGSIFLIWYWVGKFVFSILKGLISDFSQSDSRAAQNRVWYDPETRRLQYVDSEGETQYAFGVSRDEAFEILRENGYRIIE